MSVQDNTVGCNGRKMVVSASTMAALDRLMFTAKIWYIPSITRDEASSLLLNKDKGNFLVRNCSKEKNQALSVNIGGGVEHYRIQRKGSFLCLEDSELQFENIFSLILRYSNVCDELPCLLCLPLILTKTESIQHLDALSLLAKEFWNYPMSKPGRKSVILCDPVSDVDSSSSDLEEFSAKITSQLEHLTRKMSSSVTPSVPVRKTYPPRPPRRSCGKLDTPTTSPLATPPARQRRRVSDSACISPFVNGRQMTDCGRQRKQSVFMDRLAVVEESVKSWNSQLNGEADTALLTELVQSVAINRRKEKKYITEDYSECTQYKEQKKHEDKENEYSEPADYLVDEDQFIYCRVDEDKDIIEKEDDKGKGQDSNDRLSLRRQRFSDGNIKFGLGQDDTKGKRKLSLGLMIRKLSKGKLPERERKPSRTDKMFNSMIERLVTGPKRLGSSHQVDSSSWEFLPTSDLDTSISNSPDLTIHRQNETNGGIKETTEFSRGSTDSVYETEYESSTSSSLTRTSDSAFSSLCTGGSFNHRGSKRMVSNSWS